MCPLTVLKYYHQHCCVSTGPSEDDVQLVKAVEFPCWSQQGCDLISYSSIQFSFHFFFFSTGTLFLLITSHLSRSRCNSPQADWWLPGAGVARPSAERCFLQRLHRNPVGLGMDCIHQQLRSCSVLTFYGSFFLLIMSNTGHPGAVGFPFPSCLGDMNLLGTLYLKSILPG